MMIEEKRYVVITEDLNKFNMFLYLFINFDTLLTIIVKFIKRKVKDFYDTDIIELIELWLITVVKLLDYSC